MKMPKSISLNSDLDLGGTRLVKGFEGTLEYIQHDYDRLTFIPSGDCLVVEGTSQGRMSGKFYKRESQKKTCPAAESFLLSQPT
jgi:hypothetical protein